MREAQSPPDPRTLEIIPFRLLLDRIVPPALGSLRRVFLATALPMMAMTVILGTLQMRWLGAMTQGDLTAVFGVFGGLLAASVVYYAVLTLTYGALGMAAASAMTGGEPHMGRAWRSITRPAALGTLVVTVLAAGLSLMLCLVPAVFVMPLLSLVIPVMAVEGRYGMDAIRRSAELVWWNPTGRLADSAFVQTLTLLFVGGLIGYSLSFVVQAPFLITQQYLIARDAASGQIGDPQAILSSSLWLQIPTQALGTLATLAAWLYWAFGLSFFYVELRRRREGDDLRLAIDAMTGDGPQIDETGRDETGRGDLDGPEGIR